VAGLPNGETANMAEVGPDYQEPEADGSETA
jgi:hypothetical protein